MIQGQTEHIKNESLNIIGLRYDGVDVFRGVPYAEAPTGELRFAPPVPKKKWTETLDCTEWGNSGIQNISMFSGQGSISEDCLNLNIFTPAGAKPGDDCPVYVWIHGGGFALGSGSQPTFSGESYAKKGVILVTVQYRLGPLGYLSLKTLMDRYGTTGNWATLDQILALKWINENIRHFGGDNKNITIGGESAGSFSCLNLILSPMAKGLFQKAILESGAISYILGNYRHDLDKCIKMGGKFAELFGADDSEDGLCKLRDADAMELWKNAPFSFDFLNSSPMWMVPVCDGVVLPKDIYKAVRDGKYNKDVKILAGNNSIEGMVFLPDYDIGDSDVMNIIRRGFDPEYVDKVFDYFEKIDKPYKEKVSILIAMILIDFGEEYFQNKCSEYGMDVYSYVYTYRSEKVVPTHGAELPIVFGSRKTTRGEDLSPEDRKFSQTVLSYWVNFIKNGNPNGEDLIEWPDLSTGNILYLGNEIEVCPRKIQWFYDDIRPLYFHD